MIKLIVVDDQYSVIKNLELFFEDTTNISLIGRAKNGTEAIKIVEKYHPDIVLMDIVMPMMNGIEVTKIIVQRFPQTKVILLTSQNEDNRQIRIQAIKVGANGLVYKSASLYDFNQAIYLVNKGFGCFQFRAI